MSRKLRLLIASLLLACMHATTSSLGITRDIIVSQSYGTILYHSPNAKLGAKTYTDLPLTGIGEDYLLWGGSWLDLIPKLTYWKFNTVRLAFAFPDAPPNPQTGKVSHSKLDYTKLNNVLNILNSNGMKAILDLHNYGDMNGYFGSDAWENNWVNLARTYKGDKRIGAFELFNEPDPYTWSSNVKSKADVAKAFARCTDAIRGVDPERTVIWAPPRYYNGYIAPEYKRSNVVFSEHAWTDTNDVTEATNGAKEAVDYMVNWKNTYGGSIWLGEFGIAEAPDFPSATSLDAQKAYTCTLINGFIDNNSGFCWWRYSYQQEWADVVLSESKYAQLVASPPSQNLPFRDDFNVDLSKWKILKGTWKLVNGLLDGVSSGEGLIYAGNFTWTDYVYQSRVKIMADSSIREAAFVVRFSDSGNFYWLGLGCWRHRVSISRMVNGTPQELVYAGDEAQIVRDRWYELELVVRGDLLQLYVDGVLQLETKDSTHPAGAIGIRPWASHIQVNYVDITASSLDLITPLPTIPEMNTFVLLMIVFLLLLLICRSLVWRRRTARRGKISNGVAVLQIAE